MKSIIWDLDGTLIDSYDVIVSSLYDVLLEYDIIIDKSIILNKITSDSVKNFIQEICNMYPVKKDIFTKKYHSINNSRYLNIKPIENAREILDYLTNKEYLHLIYTHKGNIAIDILKNLDMLKYFTKILTIEDGFKRKPDPEAINYLIEQYNLDKSNVYYVGDRELDIISANNAGIKSILFLGDNNPIQLTGKETYVIHDLMEIKNII